MLYILDSFLLIGVRFVLAENVRDISADQKQFESPEFDREGFVAVDNLDISILEKG